MLNKGGRDDTVTDWFAGAGAGVAIARLDSFAVRVLTAESPQICERALPRPAPTCRSESGPVKQMSKLEREERKCPNWGSIARWEIGV